MVGNAGDIILHVKLEGRINDWFDSVKCEFHKLTDVKVTVLYIHKKRRHCTEIVCRVRLVPHFARRVRFFHIHIFRFDTQSISIQTNSLRSYTCRCVFCLNGCVLFNVASLKISLTVNLKFSTSLIMHHHRKTRRNWKISPYTLNICNILKRVVSETLQFMWRVEEFSLPIW